MIWYLLYPLRGTTAPPRLSKDHVVRRAFYRHGMIVAQHWLLTMLLSVAVGVALGYPTVFLSDNPTAGFTSIPRHVWTTARSVDVSEGQKADVEMRQVWVHGSYMRALEKDVLKSALTIQQSLVGGEKLASTFSELGDHLSPSELSWGYHSPLMYWNNSAAAIDEDVDIVETINQQSRSSSSLNVALRPASVLAGKTFHHRKLVAADALVLTLLNKVENGVGGKWQDKMHSLEGSACENCTLYPPHGEISRSKVYEFSFTPLSFKENAALAFAYAGMVIYVLLSLRRLKAFHSRFGLVVTAITQITTSIVASITICGVLKINLATIPKNAYPFIVLIIGIENMFRLINAILAYPPTMATDLRIANALGDVGPLSIATAAQNLIILWLLSTIVSPGVKAFCAYAIIATFFDTFFLLTFFVVVLNVDIRRLELQDLNARSNQTSHKRRASPAKSTWFDALMHGRVPFSTRMAGSAVTTTFILSLNYHFFEQKETGLKLRHLLGFVIGHSTEDLSEYESFASPPMNATLTPGEWIRMQDFDTAREVMRLVKPGAHDLVIRIFSPLIVVLSGADRTGVPKGMDAVASALRGLALHHFYPFAVVVVFVVAFVAVLMNFLLWNESPDTSAEMPERSEGRLSVQHVELPHSLDVIKIASSPSGHFMTVGLDRTIAVSVYDKLQATYFVDALNPELGARLTWPIRNIAIDDAGDLLAFHCSNDEIVFFSRTSHRVHEIPARYPDDNPALLFGFERLQTAQGPEQHFVLLTSGGRSISLSMNDTAVSKVDPLSKTPLLGASIISLKEQERRLFTVSEDKHLQCYTWGDRAWMPAVSSGSPLTVQLESASGAVLIETFPDSEDELLIVSSGSCIYLIEARTLATVMTLQTADKAQKTSLVLGQRTDCDACGSTALQNLAIVSEKGKSQELMLDVRGSESADAESSCGYCIKRQQSICNAINESVKTIHTIPQPGAWHALPSHAILGIRARPPITTIREPSKSSHLRHRRSARSQHLLTATQDEVWEAYSLSLSGELRTQDLSDVDQALYVTKPGPTAQLDSQTVVVGFGNCVKVLRTSGPKNNSGGMTSAAERLVSPGTGSRRRGTGSGRKML